MKKHRSSFAIIALLIAFLSIAVAACSNDSDGDASAAGGDNTATTEETSTTEGNSSEGVEVVIGQLTAPAVAQVAEHLGTIEEELEKLGATVSFAGPFPALAPGVEAMTAGDVDITYGSITAAVGSLAGAADFKMFATEPVQPENEAILVRSDSGIKSVEDLKGKRIAVNQAGTGHYLALLALDQAGLTADDVELVFLPPPDAANAFGGGQVDAWAIWSSYIGQAGELGGEVLVSGGELDSLNDWPYIVRSEFAEQHPDLLAAVYRGLERAAEWMIENPEEAKEYYVEFGLPESIAELQVSAPEPIIPIDTGELIDRYQQVADYMFDRKLIPTEVTIDGTTIDVNSLG